MFYSAKLWPLGVALLVCCACDPEVSEDSANDMPPVSGDTDTSGSETQGDECTTLTWQNFGRGELRNWCTGCHSSQVEGAERFGAPLGSDFDSHESVLAHRETIMERATTAEPDMPPVGGGDAEDRARLRQWLECGAP